MVNLFQATTKGCLLTDSGWLLHKGGPIRFRGEISMEAMGGVK